MAETKTKSIFTSKMFWTNLIALAGMILQAATGKTFLVNVEAQASALAVINVILRSITKDAVSWS